MPVEIDSLDLKNSFIGTTKHVNEQYFNIIKLLFKITDLITIKYIIIR